ncbi:hypothetical protein GTS_57040 [Gandjariella thermophila]|uniref:Uncharacterized protein n=1 Tax=Gandjariella thermophila TaxID=1931992 RepID=A0A4D4JBM5_9PSEU|nr:hypothetical protein GTS_57040 [Gandjariella thermophila]
MSFPSRVGALMGASREAAVRLVTLITGTVIALTFLFGFGNVLNSLNLIFVGVGSSGAGSVVVGVVSGRL